MALLGSIDQQPAILLAERAAFSSDQDSLSQLAPTIKSLKNLGANDIYHWFLATSGPSQPADLKINLIYPCTEKHVAKYSPQKYRLVTETPEIYAKQVRPYMAAQRDAGRLNWVFNILDGKAEQEDVIYREDDPVEGFLVAPDLNWDRKTLSALHVLAIVERRDIWSIRDLKKGHVEWLKHMRQKIVVAVTMLYPEIEEDQLKLYLHCRRPILNPRPRSNPKKDQPTYYHFHIHVVHINLDAGVTQAVGKAFGLENIISQLDNMAEGRGIANLSLTYSLGEAHDLWKNVFSSLKANKSLFARSFAV